MSLIRYRLPIIASFAMAVCSAVAVAATPAAKGYAPAAEGLKVYYEVYGKGDPIVVMAGGFGGGPSRGRPRVVVGRRAVRHRPQVDDHPALVVAHGPTLVERHLIKRPATGSPQIGGMIHQGVFTNHKPLRS